MTVMFSFSSFYVLSPLVVKCCVSPDAENQRDAGVQD